MSTRFELDNGTHIEFGVEICDKFQKFLSIISDIHQDYKISHLSITVFDDGESDGLFSIHGATNTISFGLKSNPEGFTISLKKVCGVTGDIKTNALLAILSIAHNFSTTIKKPRYEVFEMVMTKFCDAKNIEFVYFCQ